MKNTLYVYPPGRGVEYTIRKLLDSQIEYDYIDCSENIDEHAVKHNTILATEVDKASLYNLSYLKTFIHRGGTVLATTHFIERVDTELLKKFTITQI